MSASDPSASTKDERVNGIIADYLRSVERGEVPDRAALLARHAEFATELSAFFVDHDRFRRAAGPLAEALTLPPGESPAAGPGTRVKYFGDYELLEEIARGGMGVVYKARQISLNRPVALKMILAGQLASEHDVKRFYSEAEAAATLDHPNIVPIYEVGQHEGQHYFSMGYVDGPSLAAKLEPAGWQPKQAARLVRQVAEAIQYAHARGVIHRDLKPPNVLLGADGVPRITDFGLAKRVQTDSDLTATGQILGTPSYMSPEQAAGKTREIGPLTDVYSLGAILYALLTGRPPFEGSDVISTISRVIFEEPTSPRQHNPQVDKDLETIVLKCLQKDPSQRYSSARELANDLDRFLKDEPILARPVSSIESVWRWCRRNRAVAALTASTTLLLIAFSIASTIGYLRTSQALGEASKEKAANREQLWNTLVAQARAERRAGSRWTSLKALGDAARIRPDDLLRQEAIQTISSSGVRLSMSIPFGQASVFRLSSDGSLVAVWGTHHGDPKDQGAHWEIVSYQIADGHEVDRLETYAGHWGFGFRPGSATLEVDDFQDGRRGLRLRDVLKGQNVGFIPGATNAIYSPDGKYLSYTESGRLRVVHAEDLSEVRSWESGTARTFLNNDELLIDNGRQLIGWSIKTNRQSWAFQIPEGYYAGNEAVGSVVSLLDTREHRQTLTLWDARVAQEVARLEDAVPAQYGLRQTAPNSLLAFDVKSPHGEILLYDLVRKATQGRLEGVISAAVNFAMEQRGSLSPDGRLLACYSRPDNRSTKNTIQVWDIATGHKVASLRDCKIPLWSQDGRHLVTIARGPIKDAEGLRPLDQPEGWVKIWEVADPTPTYRQERPIEAISSSADGLGLAVDDLLWEVVTNPGDGPARLRPRPRPVAADLLAFTGSGALYAARLHGDLFHGYEQPTPFWQLVPNRRDFGLSTVKRIEGISYVNDGRIAAFSPDSRHAAVLWQRMAHKDNMTIGAGELIDLWDLATAKPIQVVYEDLYKVTFQHDGSSTSSKQPNGWAANPRQFVFSADSQKLAIAYNTGVVIYGIPRCKPERWLGIIERHARNTQHSIPAHCVAFSPDCRWVCFGGEEGRLHIGSVAPEPSELLGSMTISAKDGSWTIKETEPRVSCVGHEGTVRAVAVSPDSRILASGGEDRLIRLWELPTGRSLASWEAHEADVTAMAFRPDGRTLISGSADGILKLWDLRSIRRELAELGLDW
jgi:serine/threonine protein kinase/WD40 repeat protein